MGITVFTTLNLKSHGKKLVPRPLKQKLGDNLTREKNTRNKIQMSLFKTHYSIKTESKRSLLIQCICTKTQGIYSTIKILSCHLESGRLALLSSYTSFPGIKWATSWLSFVIHVLHLLHPKPSLFLYGLLLSLWCSSILVHYYMCIFGFFFNLMVI